MFPLIGEDVPITGAGPIGVIASGICKYAGARRVIITNLMITRRSFPPERSFNGGGNTAKEDLHTKLCTSRDSPGGFDVGLEMSGNAVAFHQLISVMRNGGKISASVSATALFEGRMKKVIP